jgi:signal transduction histidine kinase
MTRAARSRKTGDLPGSDLRRPCFLLVPIAVLAVVVATVLVHGLSRDAATASSWLAAGSLLALLVAWARARAACSRTTRELDQVCARVDETERLLGEDEDTLHEVRTALAGLVLSDRLLQEHDELLDEQTRDRLLHLRERDLDRIQHLLSGGLHHLPPAPEQPANEAEETETDPAATDDVVNDAADEVPVTALVVDALTAAQLRGEPVEEHGPDLPDATVRAEPHDVAEILDILLRNAARHAPGARVEVDVEPADDSVCVRVSDEGPGVPEGLRSTLFTRGARGPSSPGSGLGLAVARRLAERNDGALHLETTGPEGTTFALHLPAGGLDHDAIDHTGQIDHETDTTTKDTTMPTTDRLVAVPSCHAHSA